MQIKYSEAQAPRYPVLPLITAVFFFVVCIGLCTFSPYLAVAGSDELLGRVFVIDAGHGGFDGGAVGITGAIEAPINLAVAQELKKELISMGARVIMTRSDDQALAETKKEDMYARCEILAREGVTAGISIHMNNFTDSDPCGPRIFYLEGSEEGLLLATALQNAMDAELGFQSKEPLAADYMVLKAGEQVNVTVECGFLSNPADEALLQDPKHQKRLAKIIAKTLAEYYGTGNLLPAAGYEI